MTRIFVLLALGFACLGFVPGLQGPFIHDDNSNLALVLLPNPSWQQALDAVLSNGSGLLRRPLANASFLLNYLLLGDSAAAFKVINLLMHYLSGVMAFLLARELLVRMLSDADQKRRAQVALVVAMIWLAHPLNISTVLYVVQRMTGLSGLFVLSALWWLTRHFNQPADVRRLWLAVTGFYLFTLLAVLSKETGALAPVYALAACALLAHGRIRAFMVEHRGVLACTVVLPLFVGVLGLVIVFDNLVTGYADRPFTMSQRLASESVILWQYLGHILLPNPQQMHFFWDDAPIRNLGDGAVLLALASWMAVVAFAVWRYRRDPLPLFAVLWYLGGHAMESTLIALDLGYEHRNYLPMLGPLLAVVITAYRLLSGTRLPLRTLALACVAALMAATGLRAFAWSSLPRLTAHELRAAPDSLRAQYYGHADAMARGDWAGARRHLDAMRALDPLPAWIEVNLLISRCQGDPEPVDGARIRAALARAADDERTQRGLQQVQNMMIAGACIHPPPFELRTFLVAMGEQTERQGARQTAADYFYLAGSLDWAEGNLDASAAMVQRATRLAPDASQPLEQLIKVELARGRVTEARQALARAQSLWKANQPWRLYRYAHYAAEIGRAEEVVRQDLR